MLRITIPATELYDRKARKFFYTKEQTLQLEHSLVSISKWESKWCKPFLSKREKTDEETLDYIRCMTLTQNVDPDAYHHLSRDNLKEINEYINAPMTATWFSKNENGKPSREQVTSELIYFWMFSFGIPLDCQKWHLNRLITLIKICEIKQRDPKKMKKNEILARNRKLNEARRKRSGSKG